MNPSDDYGENSLQFGLAVDSELRGETSSSPDSNSPYQDPHGGSPKRKRSTRGNAVARKSLPKSDMNNALLTNAVNINPTNSASGGFHGLKTPMSKGNETSIFSISGSGSAGDCSTDAAADYSSFGDGDGDQSNINININSNSNEINNSGIYDHGRGYIYSYGNNSPSAFLDAAFNAPTSAVFSNPNPYTSTTRRENSDKDKDRDRDRERHQMQQQQKIIPNNKQNCGNNVTTNRRYSNNTVTSASAATSTSTSVEETSVEVDSSINNSNYAYDDSTSNVSNISGSGCSSDFGVAGSAAAGAGTPYTNTSTLQCSSDNVNANANVNVNVSFNSFPLRQSQRHRQRQRETQRLWKNNQNQNLSIDTDDPDPDPGADADADTDTSRLNTSELDCSIDSSSSMNSSMNSSMCRIIPQLSLDVGVGVAVNGSIGTPAGNGTSIVETSNNIDKSIHYHSNDHSNDHTAPVEVELCAGSISPVLGFNSSPAYSSFLTGGGDGDDDDDDSDSEVNENVNISGSDIIGANTGVAPSSSLSSGFHPYRNGNSTGSSSGLDDPMNRLQGFSADSPLTYASAYKGARYPNQHQHQPGSGFGNGIASAIKGKDASSSSSLSSSAYFSNPGSGLRSRSDSYMSANSNSNSNYGMSSSNMFLNEAGRPGSSLRRTSSQDQDDDSDNDNDNDNDNYDDNNNDHARHSVDVHSHSNDNDNVSGNSSDDEMAGTTWSDIHGVQGSSVQSRLRFTPLGMPEQVENENEVKSDSESNRNSNSKSNSKSNSNYNNRNSITVTSTITEHSSQYQHQNDVAVGGIGTRTRTRTGGVAVAGTVGSEREKDHSEMAGSLSCLHMGASQLEQLQHEHELERERRRTRTLSTSSNLNDHNNNQDSIHNYSSNNNSHENDNYNDNSSGNAQYFSDDDDDYNYNDDANTNNKKRCSPVLPHGSSSFQNALSAVSTGLELDEEDDVTLHMSGDKSSLSIAGSGSGNFSFGSFGSSGFSSGFSSGGPKTPWQGHGCGFGASSSANNNTSAATMSSVPATAISSSQSQWGRSGLGLSAAASPMMMSCSRADSPALFGTSLHSGTNSNSNSNSCLYSFNKNSNSQNRSINDSASRSASASEGGKSPVKQRRIKNNENSNLSTSTNANILTHRCYNPVEIRMTMEGNYIDAESEVVSAGIVEVEAEGRAEGSMIMLSGAEPAVDADLMSDTDINISDINGSDSSIYLSNLNHSRDEGEEDDGNGDHNHNHNDESSFIHSSHMCDRQSHNLSNDSNVSNASMAVESELDSDHSHSNSIGSHSRNGNSNGNANISGNRPLPDQSAFDRTTGTTKFDQSAVSPVCPATPMRTPTWSHESKVNNHSNSNGNGISNGNANSGGRGSNDKNKSISAFGNFGNIDIGETTFNNMQGMQAPLLQRQNSLKTSKVLLSVAEVIDVGCADNSNINANTSTSTYADSFDGSSGHHDNNRANGNCEDHNNSNINNNNIDGNGNGNGISNGGNLTHTHTHTHSHSVIEFNNEFINEGLLGSGTFADVYCAKHIQTNKYYAVKKSKRKFRSRKEREWLLSEVKSMKIVCQGQGQGHDYCQYIIQIVRAWQENGYFYVQIELAERGTLKDLLIDISLQAPQSQSQIQIQLQTHHSQSVTCGNAINNNNNDNNNNNNIFNNNSNSNTFNDETIWNILHDVSCGLAHIHKCGMVHLDIKPANLLITINGKIKIGDFGMASSIGLGQDGREGDTRYMAPELLESSDRQTPADVFSLGLTLYELSLPTSNSMETVLLDTYVDGNGKPLYDMKNPYQLVNIPAGLIQVGSCLPSEGPLWHVLREGRAQPLLGRTLKLQQAIEAAMKPKPFERSLPGNMAMLPEAVASTTRVDMTLSTSGGHGNYHRNINMSMNNNATNRTGTSGFPLSQIQTLPLPIGITKQGGSYFQSSSIPPKSAGDLQSLLRESSVAAAGTCTGTGTGTGESNEGDDVNNSKSGNGNGMGLRSHSLKNKMGLNLNIPSINTDTEIDHIGAGAGVSAGASTMDMRVSTPTGDYWSYGKYGSGFSFGSNGNGNGHGNGSGFHSFTSASPISVVASNIALSDATSATALDQSEHVGGNGTDDDDNNNSMNEE
jgi:serine/threonine protein kinase